jgi:hypothetical protein
MPTLSRYFIRSALICLGIGFTLGGLILAAKGGAVDPRVWIWLPVHIALLINGWLVQLTMGVAYWILPRILLGDRGRKSWAWAAFVIFQIGTVCGLLSLLRFWFPAESIFGALFAIGITAHLIGVLCFVVHAYPRIRPAMVRAVENSTN